MNFLSLLEWLMLPDDIHAGVSGHRDMLSAQTWVAMYDISKRSFERYGSDGPPFGLSMLMMRAGHGGRAGVRRILKGIYPKDERFFAMVRMDANSEIISLANRKYWFVEMAHPDDVPVKFF